MKIVVVNPKRVTERRRRMRVRLESLGVDYELRRAVHWRDLTLEQEHVNAGRKDGLNFHHGSIAACLSQRAVLADMVERGPGVMAMLRLSSCMCHLPLACEWERRDAPSRRTRSAAPRFRPSGQPLLRGQECSGGFFAVVTG